MLYNKNQFKKVNDKKVLRKIKKHWVTVSIALLGLIGGGAAATTNASANVTNQSNNDADQVNHSLTANSQTHNQQAKLVSSRANQSSELQSNNRSQSKVNVAQHAEQLHNRILFNGVKTSSQATENVSRGSHKRMLGATNDNTSTSTSTASSSASLNESTAESIAESSMASSDATSKLAQGGHRILVNSSVRSAMISGASEIASYNQMTRSNAYATVDYLDSLSTTTPELASEKSSAKSYVMKFYGNQQAKKMMITNNEAARDIKLWGEDPDFFTAYQASPGSIVNNVQSFYEPNASAFATATNSIKDQIGSLYSAQQANSVSPVSPSQSGSQSSEPFASVASNDASTLDSYNQEDRSYANTILLDLNNLDVSSVPLLSYAKSNFSKYSGRISSFMAKESNEVNSLNDQPSYSDSADENSVVSTANKDISQASLVAHDASLVMAKYIEPLEAQSSESASSSETQSDPTSVVSNTSDSSSASTSVSQSSSASISASESALTSESLESLSNSIQNSIFVSQYASSVSASSSMRSSLMKSASISSHAANPIVTNEVPVKKTPSNVNIIPKKTSQSSSSATKRSVAHSMLNKARRRQVSKASTDDNDPVHFWDDPSASVTSMSSNSLNNHPSNTNLNKLTSESNKPESSSDNQGPVNSANDSDVNNNDDDSEDPKTDPDDNQPSDSSENTSQQMDAKGARNTDSNSRRQNVQNEQGLTHEPTPAVNNKPVSSTSSNESNDNQSNSNSKLPQTNEFSTNGIEVAEISLIMSTTFGALAAYIDKHRDND